MNVRTYSTYVQYVRTYVCMYACVYVCMYEVPLGYTLRRHKGGEKVQLY